MPIDKYKAFYEIVKMLMKFDLTKLRAIQKEMSVLSKVRSSGKKQKRPQSQKTRSRKKKPTSAQLKARKEFAMRVKRGDFR